MKPRGIRNNNPGNIRTGGDAWLGKTGDDGEFLTFDKPENGLRAAARLLQTYQTKHGLKTVADIIGRWAPPDENQTAAYVQAVSIWADVEPDEPIDVHDYGTALRLLRAIVRFENGKPPEGQSDWYPPEVYERGLRLAGVSPSKKLTESRTTQGQLASGLGGVALFAALMYQVWPEGKDSIDAVAAIWTDHGAEMVAALVAFGGWLRSMLARLDDKAKGRL